MNLERHRNALASGQIDVSQAWRACALHAWPTQAGKRRRRADLRGLSGVLTCWGACRTRSDSAIREPRTVDRHIHWSFAAEAHGHRRGSALSCSAFYYVDSLAPPFNGRTASSPRNCESHVNKNRRQIRIENANGIHVLGGCCKSSTLSYAAAQNHFHECMPTMHVKHVATTRDQTPQLSLPGACA